MYQSATDLSKEARTALQFRASFVSGTGHDLYFPRLLILHPEFLDHFRAQGVGIDAVGIHQDTLRTIFSFNGIKYGVVTGTTHAFKAVSVGNGEIFRLEVSLQLFALEVLLVLIKVMSVPLFTKFFDGRSKGGVWVFLDNWHGLCSLVIPLKQEKQARLFDATGRT